MYKTILVNSDIEDGRRVLTLLEKSLHIAGAFWYHYEDDWKLVLVSLEVSNKGPRSLYATILMHLNQLAQDAEKPLQFSFERIMVIGPESLLYKTVKQNSGPRNGPVREGPALDAYIYRMA